MRSFFILTSDGTASVVEPNDENISSKIWSADFISSVIWKKNIDSMSSSGILVYDFQKSKLFGIKSSS